MKYVSRTFPVTQTQKPCLILYSVYLPQNKTKKDSLQHMLQRFINTKPKDLLIQYIFTFLGIITNMD